MTRLFETVSSSPARLGTLTTSLSLRRVTPRVPQPLLPLQLQRPLLDQLNGKTLSGRYDVVTFLVLDPTEDHFYVVYLTLGNLRFGAALLHVKMFVEVVRTRAPPPATRIGTEDPTGQVKRLEVPFNVLGPVVILPACWTSGAFLLEDG